MERLKEAIEKARAQRLGLGDAELVEAAAPGAPPARQPLVFGNGAMRVAAAEPEPEPAFDWAELQPIEVSTAQLRNRRIITRDRSDAASSSFDVLRARVLKAFRDKGWRRLAITSPTKACGKTFVSVNLALSVSRQPELRTLLVDMDLRRPAIAPTLGQKGQWQVAPWLDGSTGFGDYLMRIGDNLAVGLNSEPHRDAGELILASRTREVLDASIDRLDPDLVIYDLPPALSNDDVFSFLPNVDAVLLVTAAGTTTPDQIEACEQLFENNCAFLGVLLNKVQDGGEENYGYGY